MVEQNIFSLKSETELKVEAEKAIYTAPELIVHGRVEKLTLVTGSPLSNE